MFELHFQSGAKEYLKPRQDFFSCQKVKEESDEEEGYVIMKCKKYEKYDKEMFCPNNRYECVEMPQEVHENLKT